MPFEDEWIISLQNGRKLWNSFQFIIVLLREFLLAKVMVFKGALAKSASVVMMGNDHFVESHFVENHKVDQKISGWTLRWKIPMAFGMLPMAYYPATYGVLAMYTKACWD